MLIIAFLYLQFVCDDFMYSEEDNGMQFMITVC